MPKTQVLERHSHPKFPRLRVELRSDSKFFQAVTRLDNRLRQKSTGTDSLETAYRLAEDWYRREVKASNLAARQHPVDLVMRDPTMQELYTAYARTLDEQQTAYADQKWNPIAKFWRALKLSTITADTFREFYGWRKRNFRKYKDPAHKLSNSTLHKDKILIRQLFKVAIEKRLIPAMPLIPASGKVDANPRPWFNAAEWKRLCETSAQRIRESRSVRIRQDRQDIEDLMHFLYGSMFRVSEVQKTKRKKTNTYAGLRFKDCRVERNADGEKMLICELRTGKTGARSVVCTRDSADVYEDRWKATPDPDAFIFPRRQKDGFAELLDAAGLRKNQEGYFRNFKSMRPTSVSTRMLEQPNLNPFFISRNAGVGLGVIDSYYAKRLTAEMHKHELSKVTPLWKDSAAFKRKVQRDLRRGRTK